MGTVVSFPGLGIEVTVNRVAFTVTNKVLFIAGIVIGLAFLVWSIFQLVRVKSVESESKKIVNRSGAIVGILLSLAVAGICLFFAIRQWSLPPTISIDIYWYGLLIALGALLAIIYGFAKTKEFGLDPDRLTDVILVGVIFAVIGARLYYVVFAAPGEFTTFQDIISFRKGGLAFYGAVIFAVLSGAIMCAIRKVKIRPTVDIAAIGFLIGQGIGRWGNFVNQEAFGSNTTLPWGMTSEPVVNYLLANQATLESHGMVVDPVMPVHPTFLYESLWCLLGFLVLHFYTKHRKFDGEIFLMYLAWNGAGRAVIEGLRTDSLYAGSFRVSQLLAIVGCVLSIAAVIFFRVRINKKRKENPEYAMPYGKTTQCAKDMEALRISRETGRRLSDVYEEMKVETIEDIEEDIIVSEFGEEEDKDSEQIVSGVVVEDDTDDISEESKIPATDTDIEDTSKEETEEESK